LGEAAAPDFESPGHTSAGAADSGSRSLEFRSPLAQPRGPLAQVDGGEEVAMPDGRARAPSSPSPLDRAILGESPYLPRSSPDRGHDLDGSRVIVDSTQSTPSLRYDPRDSTVIVPRKLGSSRSAHVEYDDIKYRFHIPDGQRPGCKLVVQLPGPEVVALDWSSMHSPPRGDLARAAGLRSPGASPGASSSVPGGEAIGDDIIDNYRSVNADIKENESEIRQLHKEVRFLRKYEKAQSDLEAAKSRKHELLEERAQLLGSANSIAALRQMTGSAASPRCASPVLCTSSHSSRSRASGNRGSPKATPPALMNGPFIPAEGSVLVPSIGGASVMVPQGVKPPERLQEATKCLTPWLRSPVQDFRLTLASGPHPRRASLPGHFSWCGSALPLPGASMAHLPPTLNSAAQTSSLASPTGLAQASQAAQPAAPQAAQQALVTYRPKNTATPRSTFGYPSGLGAIGGTTTSRPVLAPSRVAYSHAGGSTVVPHGAALRQPSPQVQTRCEYTKSIPAWGAVGTQRWLAIGAGGA